MLLCYAKPQKSDPITVPVSSAGILFCSVHECSVLHERYVSCEGTWEERDMTDFSKSRITELCKDLQTSTEGTERSSEMCATVTGELRQREIVHSSQRFSMHPGRQFDDPSFLSLIVNTPPDVKSVEGEAQIVLARGKKKFIYDFSVVLHFEVKVRDIDNLSDGGLTKEKGKLHCLRFIIIRLIYLYTDRSMCH